MTNMQAAIGLAQLEKLEQHVQRKREIGALYRQMLCNVTGLRLQLARTEYAENIYWVNGILLD